MENFARVATTKKWTNAGFLNVIEEIYRRTIQKDDLLRHEVCSVTMAHMTELVEDEEFMTRLPNLEKSDEIVADLLRALVRSRNTKAAELEAALKEVERQKQYYHESMTRRYGQHRLSRDD